jgi:acyl carrier protein
MTNVSMEDIQKLVGLQLGVRVVAEHARLVEDLGAESADVANLVAAVEEKYHVIVKESEIAKIFTPADLFELVLRHLSLRGPVVE